MLQFERCDRKTISWCVASHTFYIALFWSCSYKQPWVVIIDDDFVVHRRKKNLLHWWWPPTKMTKGTGKGGGMKIPIEKTLHIVIYIRFLINVTFKNAYHVGVLGTCSYCEMVNNCQEILTRLFLEKYCLWHTHIYIYISRLSMLSITCYLNTIIVNMVFAMEIYVFKIFLLFKLMTKKINNW